MAVDFFVISCFLGGWRNYHALNDNKYSLVSVKVVNHFGNKISNEISKLLIWGF